MKKLLVAAGIAALFAGSAMADEPSAAAAESTSVVAKDPVTKGQVSFRGEIAVPTCSITAESQNKTVTLPTLWASELKDNKGKTPFTLSVEGCPIFDGKLAMIQFEPKANQIIGENLLKNTNVASNVHLKVTHGTANVLAFPVGTVSEDLPGYLGNIDLAHPNPVETFNYNVEYATVDNEAAKPGIVRATLPFTVVYQ